MSEMRGAHIPKINITCDELKKHIGATRVETGPIQIGDKDWPGVFIRGDNAGFMAMQFKLLLESLPDRKEDNIYQMGKWELEGLIKLLSSSTI